MPKKKHNFYICSKKIFLEKTGLPKLPKGNDNLIEIFELPIQVTVDSQSHRGRVEIFEDSLTANRDRKTSCLKMLAASLIINYCLDEKFSSLCSFLYYFSYISYMFPPNLCKIFQRFSPENKTLLKNEIELAIDFFRKMDKEYLERKFAENYSDSSARINLAYWLNYFADFFGVPQEELFQVFSKLVNDPQITNPQSLINYLNEILGLLEKSDK